jgi:hypothetical protein
VGGLVVVDGVRPTVTTAPSAVGAGAAGPGVRRVSAAGAVTRPAGILAGATSGVVLGSLAGLLADALACPVGGLFAGIRAEAALAARVIGLAELRPQVGQVR